MAYEEIVQLIEANKEDLAHKTIDQCLKQKFLLAGKFNYEAQTNLFESTYGIIARYIQHGNPAEWSEFIQQAARPDLDKGAKPDFVIGVGEVMIELLKELVAAELPGSENETERKRLYSRLDGMHSIAKLTLTVAQLKDVPKSN